MRVPPHTAQKVSPRTASEINDIFASEIRSLQQGYDCAFFRIQKCVVLSLVVAAGPCLIGHMRTHGRDARADSVNELIQIHLAQLMVELESIVIDRRLVPSAL